MTNTHGSSSSDSPSSSGLSAVSGAFPRRLFIHQPCSRRFSRAQGFASTLGAFFI